MTLCVIDGKACRCQPDEGQFCKLACARLVELERELDIRKAAVEAQFELQKLVATLERSNSRLRQKLDRLSS